MKKRKIKKTLKTKDVWVSSVGLASKVTGITVRVLKKARELGCPAFHASNRVNVTLLEKWMAKNESKLNTETEPDEFLKEELKQAKSNRMRSELKLIEAANMVVPKDQPLKVFSTVAKLFTSRLYILEDRLNMLFKIPKEDIRRELDAVLEPLDVKTYERLLTDAGKTES